MYIFTYSLKLNYFVLVLKLKKIFMKINERSLHEKSPSMLCAL